MRIRYIESEKDFRQRVLEFVANNKNYQNKTTCYIQYVIGNRSEILAKLIDPNINEDLNNYIKECSKKFLLDFD